MSAASNEEKTAAEATGQVGSSPAAQKPSAEEQTRRRAAIKPVTREEILAWRHEGHRY